MKKLFLCPLFFLLSLLHICAQPPSGAFYDNCSSVKGFVCDYITELNFNLNISNWRSGIIFEPNSSNTCNFPNAYGAVWTSFYSFHPNTLKISPAVMFRNCVAGATYGFRISLYDNCNCQPIYENSKYIVSNIGGPVVLGFPLNGAILPCGKYYLEIAASRSDNKLDTVALTDLKFTPTSTNVYSLTAPIKINGSTNTSYSFCASPCPYTFTVDPLPNGMCANYFWTINGVLASSTNTLNFSREEPGTKEIYLTAQLGDEDTGICSEKTVSFKVNISAPPVNKGKDIYLCQEELNSGSYIWHNQVISQAGEYRARFQEPSNCCSFDSVVNFLELPIYALNPYYFVAKNNSELYYDQKIKTVFDGCNYNKYVNSKFTLQGRECDSAYLLTTLYPKLTSNLIIETQGNSILLKPNINNITDICKTGAKFDFKYSWAKRNAPGLVVGTDQNLLISSKEDYNLNVHANITLDGKEYPFDSLFKFNLLTGVVDQQLGNSFEPIIYCSNGKLDIYISKSASQFYPIMVELHTINGIVLEKQRFIEEHVSFDMGSYTNGIYYLCFIDWSGNGIAKKVAFY